MLATGLVWVASCAGGGEGGLGVVGTGREFTTLKGMMTALTHQPVHHTPQPAEVRNTRTDSTHTKALSLLSLPLFSHSLLSSLPLILSLYSLPHTPPVDIPWRESFSLHAVEVVGDIPGWVSLMTVYNSSSTVYRQPGVCVCVCECAHCVTIFIDQGHTS